MYACLHTRGNLALLVECARRFSPLVEEIPPDAVLVDLRGLSTLFGPAQSIADALHNQADLPVNVAIASNPDAAIFAARGIRGITVIPPGDEAKVLAPLPLNLLSGSPEIADALAAWGILTFGQFAALPPLGVAARLGAEGTTLQCLARGEGLRHLRPLEDPLNFEEEIGLDNPVELLEPLLFLLARLLKELCARLTARALATDQILLVLTLENSEPHLLTLRLPLPMCDATTFLKLLHLDLDARPPAAPVLKVHLSFNPVQPRTQQHGLFLPLSPEPAKLEITLSRLYHILSPEQVGTPERLDTHRPDVFRMNRFTAALTRNLPPPTAKQTLVLRRLRPPLYARVRVHKGKPAHVATLSLQGEVTACAGPWRSSGDWWRAEPWDYAEWDVVLSDTTLCRIYEDVRMSRWFVAGHYD
jgi:protein ImuB